MRNYEIMTITNLKTGEEGARNLSNEVKDLINKYKGKVLNDDFWGKRKYAYEIDSETEGFYDVIKFEMPSEQLQNLESRLKLMDNLVRYLITAE